MLHRVVRTSLLIQLLFALSAGAATAAPASGPRETVDQSYTTTSPNSPTGLGYTGRYHAAGDESGEPPYMRRMVFYPPAGFRFDTSAPDQCSATDAELAVMGPDACPPGSILGEGATDGLFYAPITHALLDNYTQHLDLINNANEQILLIESEGYTVQRGKIHPDNSVEFNPTTCFPAPPAGQCPDDYVLQLGSTTTVPLYTKTTTGGVRSYATTPPECPREGYWSTTVRFWWADGNEDSVVTTQPCSKRAAKR